MRVDPEPALTGPGSSAACGADRRSVGQTGIVNQPYDAAQPRPSAPSVVQSRAPQPAESRRPPLVRPADGRVVAGVCAGVSAHLGIPLGALRVLTAVSALLGFGLPVYAFLWLTMPKTADGGTDPVQRAPMPARRFVPIGVVVLVIGGVSAGKVLTATGHLSIALPLLVIAAGVLLVWSRLDRAERRQWIGAEAEGRQSLLRIGFGVLLAVVGLVLLITQGRSLSSLRDTAISVVVVLVGAGFVAAPFITRLFDSLRQEQTERIRATEKADIAAHLHDSVLQTLALIQRRASDPQAVQLLARAQERELRTWLYADNTPAAATLATAVTDVTHEIEDLHGIPVDLVVSGDRPIDAAGMALTRALREALANAVRHGAPPVSVYLEVGSRTVEAFVRDHGAGFDLDAVAEDRLGVRESIIGRMQRHGGAAQVRRREDGTEVCLRLDDETLTSTARDDPGAAGVVGDDPDVPANTKDSV